MFDRYRVGLFFLLVTAFAAGYAIAGGSGSCAHCGGSGPCRKVCRLVSEEKSISITCWGCKCEDFCLPGPSCPGCEQCETVCATCDETGKDKGVYALARPLVWKQWIPGGAKLHTKKKLMKKVVTKKVPSHKWVVEDLCDECAQNSTAQAAR